MPPGCIIFEGQGNLKSSSVTVMNPGGVKVEREQNWFDAFVTFMHPASSTLDQARTAFCKRLNCNDNAP
jgi:hypothetical protein